MALAYSDDLKGPPNYYLPALSFRLVFQYECISDPIRRDYNFFTKIIKSFVCILVFFYLTNTR